MHCVWSSICRKNIILWSTNIFLSLHRVTISRERSKCCAILTICPIHYHFVKQVIIPKINKPVNLLRFYILLFLCNKSGSRVVGGEGGFTLLFHKLIRKCSSFALSFDSVVSTDPFCSASAADLHVISLLLLHIFLLFPSSFVYCSKMMTDVSYSNFFSLVHPTPAECYTCVFMAGTG